MFEDMQQSSNEFYQQVEQHIEKHNLANTKLERVNIAEGGMFSSKRESAIRSASSTVTGQFHPIPRKSWATVSRRS